MTIRLFKFTRNIGVVLLCCLASLRGEAEMSYVSVDGEGRGMERKAALEDALSDAVGRVNGLAIATKSHAEIEECVATINSQSTAATRQTSRESVNVSTSGHIKSYRILAEGSDDKGFIEITIQAEIARYEAKENDRIRLAVMRCLSKKSSYDCLDKNVDQSMLTRRTTQKLVDDLTSSRKFAVIDQEYDAAREAEMNRILGDKVSPEERAKLNQEIAADYVVVAKIEDLSITTDTALNTPNSAAFAVARCTIPYRVIDLVSGVTVLAQTAVVEVTLPLLGADHSGDKPVEDLIGSVSDKISERILQTIYPIKVISTSAELVLNTGDGMVASGQTFNVYNLGKRLEDPYTKEFLGYEETFAAKIQVTRVLPKVSYATVLNSQAEIKTGAVCRPSTAELKDASDKSKTKSKPIKNEIDDLFK
jgi:hypothetical protein